MKVRELIKQLLNYNLDAVVERRVDAVDVKAAVSVCYNHSNSDKTVRLVLYSETLAQDEKKFKPLPTTCKGLASLHDEWSRSNMRGLPFLKFLEQQGYPSE